ncbi:hypothetical protein BD410DRAFT_765013 [Rickenella mellea]|uniref:Type 1 phosphatases regulator n=1 Tax=Rickenella mellea TaxID=50990 RepID=A0A4Y7QDQ5_9AGAM|nr:hypothetical protein BD410DRAFT_765013 [Rickenella mellea]
MATRFRPQTSAPGDGSRTLTVLDSQPREEATGSGDDGDECVAVPPPVVGVLRLRGGPRSRPRVAWTDDVVDNEGMGKKKSKICCIYHKPRRFDESSDESSSDSDSDHDHDHHKHCKHDEQDGGNAEGSSGAVRRPDGTAGVAELEDLPEPNAYERQPPNKSKKGKEKE